MEPYAETIRRRYPNWDNFTVGDMSRLNRSEREVMNGTILARSSDLGDIIPRSFFERYGDGAYAQFARAIARESRQAGDPEVLGRTILEGGYSGGAEMRYGSAPYNYPDGRSVQSTAPGMMSAQMAYESANGGDRTMVEVAVPYDARRALSRDNPQYVSREQGEAPRGSGSGIEMRDEGGYLTGYYSYGSPSDPSPSRRGAGSAVIQVVPNYDENTATQALPQVARDLHDPRRPDVPVAFGYVAGWDQSRRDARTGYAGEDDYLYDQPAPRTPAGASFGSGRSSTPPPPPR